MKKKIIIGAVIAVILAFVLIVLYKLGYITFESYGANDKTVYSIRNVDELKNGAYYIWHNDASDDIRKDLNSVPEKDVFFLLPVGKTNWDKDTFVTHTIWFTSDDDYIIPTMYPGDKLLYVSINKVPYKGISWERYADYGYTLGVANLIGDTSGHYRITSNGNSYKGYVFEGSDANQLNRYGESVTDLFLDKVGGFQVRDNLISDGGTVIKLDKDQEYICEWYTGTYYQDFKMKANVRTFSFLESFTSYSYEFLHSNVIEITIPEWLKTGYYYVENVGMFRYVSAEDAGKYNGKAYDSGIDWNDPIIIRNEEGTIIYDPISGIDKREQMGY